MTKERKFHEFIGLFYDEDEILQKKSDTASYLMIDLNSVVAWNQCDNNTTVVELEGCERYKLDIHYSEFKKLMNKIFPPKVSNTQNNAF